MPVNNESVFGNQKQIMSAIGALPESPLNEELSVKIPGTDKPIGLGITYGTAIALILGTVAGEVIAKLLPESLKSKLGVTNQEVITVISEAIAQGTDLTMKTSVTIDRLKRS